MPPIDPAESAPSAIYGHFDGMRGRAACGWAWCPQAPDRQVTVTIIIDGNPAASGVAADHRPDLEQAGAGDGNKSFALLLPIELMDGQEHEIVARDEDGAALLGTPCRMILPDLRFRPLPAEPLTTPFELAVCCIVKNEAPYLLEWIAYHRVVGVEHFLVFDNDSDDQTPEILARLAGQGVLERLNWPTGNDGIAPQISAYQEGLRRLRNVAKWIAFIDLDEFLLPLAAPDVQTVLRHYDDAGALVVPWRIFGSSGENHQRNDLVIRRFTRRAEERHFLNHSVKTIVQTRCAAQMGVHTPVLAQGCLIDEHRVVVGGFGNPDHHPVPEARNLVINHYFGKSRAEWEAKRRKGRADGPGPRRDSDFAAHDRNEVEDRSILRFEPAVEAEIARLAGP